MIVLDAYAVISVLAAESASTDVEALLRGGDCGVNALNLAEAADVLERTQGIEVSQTRNAVETLVGGGALTIVDVDDRCAWRAAESAHATITDGPLRSRSPTAYSSPPPGPAATRSRPRINRSPTPPAARGST